jgi:hypothetical protein
MFSDTGNVVSSVWIARVEFCLRCGGSCQCVVWTVGLSSWRTGCDGWDPPELRLRRHVCSWNERVLWRSLVFKWSELSVFLWPVIIVWLGCLRRRTPSYIRVVRRLTNSTMLSFSIWVPVRCFCCSAQWYVIYIFLDITLETVHTFVVTRHYSAYTLAHWLRWISVK